MSPRRDPAPRVHAWGHWLGGFLLLGILGGAVVAAAVGLWQSLDLRQVAPGLATTPSRPPEPAAVSPAGSLHGRFSAVILRLSRNRAFYPDERYYEREVTRWAEVVASVGGHVRQISSLDDLARLRPDELLVLPEAPCLSGIEIQAIRTHLRRGGSLVSNWAVGARDARCNWRGWQTVAEFSGAHDVRELARRDGLYFTVPGGLPLSPGLDPGTRVELRPEPTLALNQPGARVYWSDWALNPAPDEAGGTSDVAATVGKTPAGGRIAWFGFHLSQASTPRDSLNVYRMVQNGVRWGAGVPMASVAAWPDGRRAALVLVQDVEAEHRNALALAKLLKELSLPGSFYAVSGLVKDDPELAEALSEAGEIGSHSADHRPVAGLALDDQRNILRREWGEIRGWAGEGPAGFRPPEESFDANTLRAWAESGGRYVIATNQARSGSPEVHGSGRDQMILLPRLMKDDYNVFVQDGALKADRLTEAFLEGARKIRAVGGLAIAALHTQIAGTGSRLQAVRALADTTRANQDWWTAQADEVADWWRLRSSIVVRFLAPADSESGVGPEIVVEAPRGEDIEGLWLDVVLPNGADDVRPTVNGSAVAFTVTEWGIRVPVGRLPAGGERLVAIRSSSTSVLADPEGS
jgi:peptidoglycan/xylan/chitin deacetylase (PgdA/CDA1 family)